MHTKGSQEFSATLKIIIEGGNDPPQLIFNRGEAGVFGKRNLPLLYVQRRKTWASLENSSRLGDTLAKAYFILNPMLKYHSTPGDFWRRLIFFKIGLSHICDHT